MSTPARSVQFKNASDVLAAFINREVPAFSIWQGKQFMFKFEGDDIADGATYLEELLKVLNQSAAIYTLRVYEDLPGGKIKSNTPDDGSFNFRLLEETAGMSNYNNNALASELAAVKLQLKQMQEDDDDDDDNNKLGLIGDVISHPVVQQLMPEIIAWIKGTAAAQPAAKIAGIPDNVTTEQKINEALFILNGSDPLLADHLYKLATIARDQPKQFKMLIGMLDAF